MLSLSYDMHLHSCLSPCGDDESTPANIIGMASILGLDLVALTDHNTCKNCEAFLAMAESFGILAIPGMELTTSEEVHVLCYFPSLEDAMAFSDYVRTCIPGENIPKFFGNQLIYNVDDEQVGIEDAALIEATTISFFDLEELVPKYNGIYGPAHVDKNSNSLLSNLGFVPFDARFHFAEFHQMSKAFEICEANPYLKSCRLITDSDAHRLEAMNEPVNRLHVKERTREAVLEALLQPPV